MATADPSNALVAGDDPLELLRRVADRVVSMHASDRYLAPGASFEEMCQSDGTLGYPAQLFHRVTVRGLNDYHAIFRILAEHDYHGWVSIEDGMKRDGGNGGVTRVPPQDVRKILHRRVIAA